MVNLALLQLRLVFKRDVCLPIERVMSENFQIAKVVSSMALYLQHI